MLSADPSPWLAVLGRAHPLLLHAPLGLLPGVALLEYGALLLRRPCPRGAVLALAWFAALTAIAAAASGLVLAGEGGYGAELLGRHKIAGLTTAGLALASAIAACFANRAPLRVVLLLTLGAMVPAGHFGGSLTHGSDFLFEPLARRDDTRATTTTPGNPAPAATVPASDYVRVIQPLLARVCTSCHNPDKLKGELLLTTPDGIQRGGENGPVVAPGRPDDSPLLQRVLLPLEHDDHMPPDGKPQPTDAEIAALRAWIAAGATF